VILKFHELQKGQKFKLSGGRTVYVKEHDFGAAPIGVPSPASPTHIYGFASDEEVEVLEQ
jgi:hypothetical protein